MFDTTFDRQAGATSTIDTEASALTDLELCDAIATNAAHIAVAECRYVLLIAEFDRRSVWNTPGCLSAAHWLNWRCGTSMGAAREQVRVGRALGYLPIVRQAFASGEISYSKVRAITRIATAKNETQLVEWAKAATAAQMEQIVRCHRRSLTDGSGKSALNLHNRRYLRSYTDDEGMIVIEARLTPEDGSLVLRAIEAAREALRVDLEPKNDGSNEPAETVGAPELHQESRVSAETPFREDSQVRVPDVSAETLSDADVEGDAERENHDVSAETLRNSEEAGKSLVYLVVEGPDERQRERVDGLVEVCRSALAGGLTGSEKEPSVNVMVHVDEQVLANPEAHGCSFIEEVGGICPHTARRLACDAGIFPLVYGLDGQIEAEAKTRSIPAQMRRSILARDQGCRWPGCTRRKFVDVHHVVFWSNGGKTTPSNLVSLCKYHHRLVHEGGYRLEMDSAARVRVWTPEGIEIPAVPQPVNSSGFDLQEHNRHSGLTIDEDTMKCGYAEPFDIYTTTEWLYYNSGPLPWENDPASPCIN